MAEPTRSEICDLLHGLAPNLAGCTNLFNPLDLDADANVLVQHYNLKIQSLPGSGRGPAFVVEYGVFEDMTKPYVSHYAKCADFESHAEAKRYAICHVVARLLKRDIMGVSSGNADCI